jgi:hypothetical protein
MLFLHLVLEAKFILKQINTSNHMDLIILMALWLKDTMPRLWLIIHPMTWYHTPEQINPYVKLHFAVFYFHILWHTEHTKSQIHISVVNIIQRLAFSYATAFKKSWSVLFCGCRMGGNFHV